jgi:ANTAR domain
MTNPLQAPATNTQWPSAATNGRYLEGLQSQDLVAELDGLQHRLATQPVIEQSKGILMCHFGIDPDTAFDVLKRWSSHTNLKVRDISQILVNTATANPPGDHRRASQELINLIHCFNKGQIPRLNEC